MTELQTNAAEVPLVTGLHHLVVRRSQQAGVGVIERQQHRLDGAVSLFAAFNCVFKSLLAKAFPADPIELVRVQITLVHKTPAFHHQLLRIVERQGLRAGKQNDENGTRQTKSQTSQTI